MQFDQTDLRLFLAVAEIGSITVAAERQHLSLGAASARIKALESKCEVQLLTREARGVRLLPAGEALLHHARLLLAQAEQLRGELHEYRGGLRGHLRIFANTTAVTDLLPEVLPGFLNRNPQISVDLQEKPNALIPRGVLDGRADIGIVAGQVDTLGLESIHFSTDRLVLVTSRKHRFAKRRRISFVETLDEDAIGMQQGSTLQAFLGQISDNLGKHQKRRVRLSNFDAMCRMIGSGVGIGVVPESAARRNQDAMQLALIELTDPWCVRERYLLVRERARLPTYAGELVDILCAAHKPG